ncbi:hybrid sensor histidine kinase/response regulator [Variovorax sp. VNK109]|jgi:two-component system response regulator PhcR|uniref:hybrid sensor histidine kinase/response regulator n=1 Tax=Variovorax sp. VNK109 TaxID=3400919 RepID=UPI003C053CE9
MSAVPPYTEAYAVLYVDDEPQARKWFERSFGDEFTIITADGVDEALRLLEQGVPPVAVLATDYRMPGRNGLDLLLATQRDHRHVIRLLVTAFAEKEVAIAAVNQGQVFRILEKPLDGLQTRQVLREAIARHRAQVLAQALHESRVLAVRETLGFLAHELNTPLTTVRGYMSALRDRHVPALNGEAGAMFTEQRPGEILTALEAAERNALYCQSLVSTFVRSARDAYPGVIAQSVTAGGLVQVLLNEYPFEEGERDCVRASLGEDFALPGQRDLLFLVLSTLTKNALLALRGRPAPSLSIELGRENEAPAGQPARCAIRFIDNGPGIPPEILSRLTREPVTTRAHSGGSGMGLMFCRRVVQSLGGAIDIESNLGKGACVSLYFPSLPT